MIDQEKHNILRQKYNPDGSTLREYQLYLLDMLKWFDDFCQKEHITYWLSSGTCLGAVRHGGFIPWDDDIDVEMLEEDYVRLLKIFKETDDYGLQTYKNDKYYLQQFAKLRDKHSKITEKECNHLDDKYKYRGAFMDIFPIEYTPKFIAWLVDFVRMRTIVFIGIRAFNYSGFKRKLLLGTLVVLQRIYFYCFLPVMKFPFKFIKGKTLRHSVGWYKVIRKREELFPLTRIDFEGVSLPVPKQYDKYLTRMFGDYMQIPSEDSIQTHELQIQFNR